MLPPVTKRWDDRSTDRWFRFVFYCDRCGAAWESERYPFSLREAAPQSSAEESARMLLWRTEHDAAYERANTEALFHFNRCPVCGARVCDSCYLLTEDLCASCAGMPVGADGGDA